MSNAPQPAKPVSSVPSSKVFPPVIVVARANFAEDETGRRFQNLDGRHLDGLAPHCKKMILLAPVFRRGRDAQYEMMKNFSFRFSSPNVEVVELPDSRGSRKLSVLLRAFRDQLQILRRVLLENPDAIAYIFFPTYRAAAAALLCRLQRRPYIVFSGGMWADTIRLSPRWSEKRPWYLPLYLSLCRILERLTFPYARVRMLCEAVRLEKYQKLGGTFRAGPWGNPHFAPEPVPQSLHAPPRILFVADVLPLKGHDTMYQAIALLNDKGLRCSLALAGAAEPSWWKQLQELAGRLGITDQITYHGWIANADRVAGLYRSADIFVLPSRSEGFPRVVYEAMAGGLAVVTTDIPNIALVIEHERQAVLVPPDNPAALADAFERVLRDDILRHRIRLQAWNWVREEYHENDVEKLVRILHQYL